jgi:hypothetical protein
MPLAGILIGLSFAWAGNMLALLQSSEIRRLSTYHPGGFAEYVYLYQLAILLLLIALCLWGLAGLGLMEVSGNTDGIWWLNQPARVILFGTCSLAIRTCWQVVGSVSLMLIAQKQIADAIQAASLDDEPSKAEGSSTDEARSQ